MPTARATFFPLVLAAVSAVAGSTGASMPDARVVAVHAAGSPGRYTFDVTISSNDTGCSHYADWWEVVDGSAALVYRRVLLHDHADEQPFTRDGGPVAVEAEQVVTVRAHVNTSGYSAAAMRGSVARGFEPVTLPDGFATGLAERPPLPGPC